MLQFITVTIRRPVEIYLFFYLAVCFSMAICRLSLNQQPSLVKEV